jgi:hypothetical protein
MYHQQYVNGTQHFYDNLDGWYRSDYATIQNSSQGYYLLTFYQMLLDLSSDALSLEIYR